MTGETKSVTVPMNARFTPESEPSELQLRYKMQNYQTQYQESKEQQHG